MRRLITEREAAIMLNCSVYKLQRDRRIGSPIPYKKVGRSVRYDIADIETYLERQTYISTSTYKAG